MNCALLKGDVEKMMRINRVPGLLPAVVFSSGVFVSLLSGSAIADAQPNTQLDPLLACNAPEFQRVLQPAFPPAQASAYWLDRQLAMWPGVAASGKFKLYYSANATIKAAAGSKVLAADGYLSLQVARDSLPAALGDRFKFVKDGAVLKISDTDLPRLPALHRQQLLLVQEDASGVVLNVAALQVAGALDDLYAMAKQVSGLGVSVSVASGKTRFKLWAPTARKVSVCLYESGNGAAKSMAAMRMDQVTGVWSVVNTADLSDGYYQYVVEVFVPGVGFVRNRVTDPYSISLTTDSRRSYIARLDAPRLQPKDWAATPVPLKVRAQTELAVYELHVRDFSINDSTVSPVHRGKYLAFTESSSNGMKHLQALAQAGMTDVHLLPVFDFASVPEVGCLTPQVKGVGGSKNAQADMTAIAAIAARDCFNWGYDPFHYSAPEGSYATDAADGASRILEFRQMVAALHKTGLRVGMDVVYNHTDSTGQKEKSVLDRIVPGYYHRLNASGEVEQTTCTPCGNTATENMMMGKLMIDSVVQWARDYKIDSFRFDLMGHQPRSVMEELQASLKAATGREIALIGEGWNFGEVANGARFVQASQLSLNGSGIGTFSDRARDAVRGGGDLAAEIVRRKGYINGLADLSSGKTGVPDSVTDLLKAADMVRVGLAGSLRDYAMTTYDGSEKKLSQIDYAGQPAGYVSTPAEVVNYVENHDNQTLFDINVYKLPPDTPRADRVRVQMLGLATTMFSQGVAYFHAGVDILRSKSMDRNSYNSGDWFNRLDWTYQDNYFATGLPPEADNGAAYPVIQPLLGNPLIKPGPEEIALARGMFLDLLAIRSSSSLFHLRSAAEVQQRLHFENVGPQQNGAVIAAQLDGRNYPEARFTSLMYFINVASEPQTVDIASTRGQDYRLHPVHVSATAADQRIATEARYEAAQGKFTLPARSAVVFVR
jgi:pullulanase/glycogen debranching enzyme